MLNTAVLAASHYNMSAEFNTVLESLNILFMLIFALEAITKIIAMRRAYFKDAWNLFDFSIITLAILIYIPISMGYFKSFQGLTTAIRVLRVARMLRLVVKARKI